MRLSHDNLLTHFLGKVPYTSWLFTIYKNIPESLVGNFGSVKTVRVVHHLPKISELSRRASRLDSSYKMKLVRNSRNLMHQPIAAALSRPPPPPPPPPRPPPPPLLLRTICPPCQSRGLGICKFCVARGPGICQPRGHFRAFDTHAVSYQNITTQRILLGKKADWLICQGHEKLKRFVKACSWFYACISSLLIKPELHSEIGAIDVNQRFLVIESNFCWYYLKNILSYL